jgi:hypothetical protein
VELFVRDIAVECGGCDVLVSHEQLDRAHTHTLCVELGGKGPATRMRRVPHASLFVEAGELHTQRGVAEVLACTL